MASTKTAAFFALALLAQCAYIQCHVLGPNPYSVYGGGLGELIKSSDNNDLDALLPFLLLSLLNKNQGCKYQDPCHCCHKCNEHNHGCKHGRS